MTGRDRRRPPGVTSVAFAVPLQGPTGIYGPSCLTFGELAAEQLNAGGGIGGREVELVLVDAGRHPDVVADEVAALVSSGRVDAVAGWHISAVRQAITRRVGGRVVYAFAAMHEGGDDTPGVFMVGERPTNQLIPAAHWMRENHGASRWSVIGNDYIFPHVTASTARRALLGTGSEIVQEAFVPLGTSDFTPVLEQLRSSDLDGVIMLLMGQDAVHFNRQFSGAGLSQQLPRLSPAVEENTLLGGGAAANDNLFAAAAYFDGLAGGTCDQLASDYLARFGPHAPAPNAVGESCFEAVHFLAHLARACGSLDVAAAARLSDGFFYESPRGLMRLRGNLIDQDVHIAVADGLEFRVQDQIATTA